MKTTKTTEMLMAAIEKMETALQVQNRMVALIAAMDNCRNVLGIGEWDVTKSDSVIHLDAHYIMDDFDDTHVIQKDTKYSTVSVKYNAVTNEGLCEIEWEDDHTAHIAPHIHSLLAEIK